MTFDPVLPIPVLCLLAGAFITVNVLTYWKLGYSIGRAKNSILALFRFAGLVLVFGLLLQPSRREQLPPATVNRVTLVGIDTSRSMKQGDVGKTSRLEAARNLLYEANMGTPRNNEGGVHWFQFSTDATPIITPLEELKPEGTSTRMHRSILSMLNSLKQAEEGRALILLTDGHDFEMVNPVTTGLLARSRHMPIYAVALGQQTRVRDVSIHIGNYQPYSYVKQKAHITGVLRLIGCQNENLTIQLLRKNQVIQTRNINAGDNAQMTVDFDVVEQEIGQYEYEIKVLPLEHEIDATNNSALTYLNVIDQQIQILLLEGSPYWDTTFLQRSLMRNDKINIDVVVQYSTGHARVIRKKGGDLKIPATQDDFGQYDLIILGKSVDRILDAGRVENLQQYVKEHGGTVIFSRGRAFDSITNDLEPVIWDPKPSDKVRLRVSREGQALAPFKVLSDPSAATEPPPDLIAGHGIRDRKPLTAVLAQAEDRQTGETTPGFVHRRFGQGQVLSVGVDGLWHWAFNLKAEESNSLYDRFWDQMVLWLMAGRDFLPNKAFSFRCSSANVSLGERVYFKLVMRSANPQVNNVLVTVFKGDKEVGQSAMMRDENRSGYRLSAEFLPEKAGRYRAVATLPDGSQEESKFIVIDENREETEVATDVSYLKRLCESSGGRLITPDELKKLSPELDSHQTTAPSISRIVSIWDRAWIFYLIGLLFGVDWYFRRRWGLC